MGTNSLQDIPLNWGEIFYPASVDMDLNEMLEAHSAIFQEGLGKLEGVKAKIYVDPMDFLHFSMHGLWPMHSVRKLKHN